MTMLSGDGVERNSGRPHTHLHRAGTRRVIRPLTRVLSARSTEYQLATRNSSQRLDDGFPLARLHAGLE